MLDASSTVRGVVSQNPFHLHLNDSAQMMHQNSYQGSGLGGVVSHMPPQHLNPPHPNTALQQNPNPNGQQPMSVAAAAAAVAAMSQSPHRCGCVMPQVSHGISNRSQTLAAALFSNSPLINDNLKLAAAAAAAVVQSRGKKCHRAEPVPQSGFKGVSWNSRMKAWLAFYVTENGERKSKTFSTRKLGMEEARLQAIAFCKQKQDQRREARKRDSHKQNCASGSVQRNPSDQNEGLNRLSSEESMLESPDANQPMVAMRCGYPAPSGVSATGNGLAPSQISLSGSPDGTTGSGTSNGTSATQSPSLSAEIAYIPIVPISGDMIEKSGLLQPLELKLLPPCQHCNKQPYPFLMIVSEGQEQLYGGGAIKTISSQQHHGPLATSSGPMTTTSLKFSDPNLDHQQPPSRSDPSHGESMLQSVNGTDSQKSNNPTGLASPTVHSDPGLECSGLEDPRLMGRMESQKMAQMSHSLSTNAGMSQTTRQQQRHDRYLTKTEPLAPYDRSVQFQANDRDHLPPPSNLSMSSSTGRLPGCSPTSANELLGSEPPVSNHTQLLTSPSTTAAAQSSSSSSTSSFCATSSLPSASSGTVNVSARCSDSEMRFQLANDQTTRHSIFPSTVLPSTYSHLTQMPPMYTSSPSQSGPVASTQSPVPPPLSKLPPSSGQSTGRCLMYSHQNQKTTWAPAPPPYPGPGGPAPAPPPHMNLMDVPADEGLLKPGQNLSMPPMDVLRSDSAQIPSEFDSSGYQVEPSASQLQPHTKLWGLNNILTSFFLPNNRTTLTSGIADLR